MRRVHFIVLCALMFISVLGCAKQEAPAAAEPQKFEMKPVAEVYELMESLVAHMAQDIWDSVKVEIDAKGTRIYKPETKEAWDEVGFAAKGLAETANLLMLEGRAQDQGNWAKYSTDLMNTSLDAAKAAKEQNFDGLMDSGGRIYDSCKGCHDEYLQKVQMKRTGGKPAEAPVTAPPGSEPK